MRNKEATDVKTRRQPHVPGTTTPAAEGVGNLRRGRGPAGTGLFFRPVLILALLVLGAAVTRAVTETWTGASSANWSADGNWAGDGFDDGDGMLFNASSTANLSTANDLTAPIVQGITVTDPAGTVGITGNPFALGAGGVSLTGSRDLSVSITSGIVSGTTGQMTIGADQAWEVGAGRKLTMSALAGTGDKTLLLTGGGQVQFVTGQVSINWAGTTHLRGIHVITRHELGGDPNNSLGSGTWVLEDARLDLTGNKSTQTMPIDLQVTGASTIGLDRGGNNNTVNYGVATFAIGDDTFNLYALDTLNTRTLSVSNSLSLNGRPTFHIRDSVAILNISNGVLDPSGLADGLVKTGSGLLAIVGNAAYSYNYGGPIIVEQGAVRATTAAANNLGGASGHLILRGGGFESWNNAAVTYATPVTVEGTAYIQSRPNGGTRAGSTHSFGALTMAGGSLAARTDPLITSGTQTIAFSGTSTTFSYGANTFTLDRSGGAGLALQTGNNWVRQNRATAHVEIATTSTTFKSAPAALAPDGARLPMVTFIDQASPIEFARTDGTLVLPLTTYSALPAAGGDTTTAYSVTGGTTLTGDVDAFLLKVTASGAGQSLDLGGNTLGLNYSGGSAGGGMLFSGSNGYSLANGTVSSSNTELVLHQCNSGGLTVTAALDVGSGGLTKAGSGDLTFTTGQTFTGDLTINEGALILSGAGAVSQAGTIRLGPAGELDLASVTGNAYTLGNAQTLTGIGTVLLGNTDLTVAGTISPGFSPGDLTFTSTGGDLILAPNSTLLIEIAGLREGEYDRIILDGGTFVTGGTLQFSSSLTDLPEVGTTITLFDLTGGTFAGAFTSILNPELGGELFWDTSRLLVDGTITAAVPIPEPVSAALLGLLAASLLARGGLARPKHQRSPEA
jgi:autotransporter-associated beta strand protein